MIESYRCLLGGIVSGFFWTRTKDSPLVDYQQLRTVRQLAAEAPFVTESKLRWWIFHSDKNGLDQALIKVGGRVYIDRAEFNRWLEGQRVTPKEDRSAA